MHIFHRVDRLLGFEFQPDTCETFLNIFVLSNHCNFIYNFKNYPTKLKYADINTCFVKHVFN